MKKENHHSHTKCLTKRAPDAGDSAARFASSIFLRLSLFLAGRLRRPRPSAGNANRWAVPCKIKVIMKTKTIITVCLVAFILASCVPAAKVAPTETAFPTSTFTPNPTKTLRPTEAPTATATKDPNEPVGATGLDENGYYKEADGAKYYATEFVDAKGEIIWASNHTNGTVNLIPALGGMLNATPWLPIEFFASEDLGMPNIGLNSKYKSGWGAADYGTILYNTLSKRYVGKPFSAEVARSAKYSEFVGGFGDGTLPIAITTSTGEHTILLKNLKLRVIVVNPGNVPSPDLKIKKIQFESQVIIDEKHPNEVIILESMDTDSSAIFARLFYPVWLLVSSPEQQSYNLLYRNSTIDRLQYLMTNEENPYLIVDYPPK